MPMSDLPAIVLPARAGSYARGSGSKALPGITGMQSGCVASASPEPGGGCGRTAGSRNRAGLKTRDLPMAGLGALVATDLAVIVSQYFFPDL